jgi:lysophospholipase L1-like esterase
MTKTILSYGASNTWGFIPGSFDLVTGLAMRYLPHERWTGILQKELGHDYYINDEALNGRTTIHDDIENKKPYRNGLTQLTITLESHYPIDLIIFMLGTNDTKIRFNQTSEQIAEGMRQLIKIVKNSNKGRHGNPPKILIIAPQPIIDIREINTQSEQLAKQYQLISQQEKCAFLDAGLYVKSSIIDGVHLDKTAHNLLGKAVAMKVKEIL